MPVVYYEGHNTSVAQLTSLLPYYIAFFAVVALGLVLLILWAWRHRRAAARQARDDSPQEGVWPPPPNKPPA